MISTGQFASVIVAALGALLFWANPKRKVNRAIFASSASVSAWLFFDHLIGSGGDSLRWVRWTNAAGGLIPLTQWMVKESIVGTFQFRNPEWLRRNILWFLTAAALVIIPFTDFFIPAYSTELNRAKGPGYYLYYVGLVTLNAQLLRDSLRAIRSLSGARRLELQVWLCGGCIVASLVLSLIGLSGLTHNPVYHKLKPVAVLIFYAVTAYAITSHRIFDGRQIILLGTKKFVLILIGLVVAFALNRILELLVSDTAALMITTIAVITTAGWMSAWLDQRLQFSPQDRAARQAAFAIAQRETRLENLDRPFTELLRGWGKSERAAIFSTIRGGSPSPSSQLENEESVFRVMKSLRWVTPERLNRERSNSERQCLTDLLAKHELGVLVIEEGQTVSLLVGVGIGTARRPYTYPQVTQLIELATIIQGAFERAHLSKKAQQSEHLATVGILGASVAHEIRNPLVSIKTFVQLLPTHYQDPVFREKFFRLIGGEVDRIDQLTEQLLDLSSPRTYLSQMVALHPLLRSTVELALAKATDRQVALITDFQASPDLVYTDPSAAKQVIMNLCFNAIQAVENHTADERWVTIGTRSTKAGIEMVVADNGPGIAPEIRPRLFQPFQTTKSSGFGLGLAVCSDILSNLQASIRVDPYEQGRGATFRVIFPCQPS